MKLSDIKGERTIDVIADIIDPIANIASDDTAAELFSKKAVPEWETTKSFLLGRIKKSLPALLRGHKTDVIEILAAISDVTPEEYSQNMTLLSLTADVLELLGDEAFIQLFTSAQTGNSSGSAQEITTDQGN